MVEQQLRKLKARTNKKQQITFNKSLWFDLSFLFSLKKKTNKKTTHSTTLHYTMHMAWVGLTRFHLHLNPRSPARNPSLKEDPVGVCVCWGGVGGFIGVGMRGRGGMHWARGAETFAHAAVSEAERGRSATHCCSTHLCAFHRCFLL